MGASKNRRLLIWTQVLQMSYRRMAKWDSHTRSMNYVEAMCVPSDLRLGLRQGPRSPAGAATHNLEGLDLAESDRHDDHLGWLYKAALWLKIAQKPYIIWSLGPKTVNYESSEP